MYAPEEHKVSAPIDAGVKTEVVSPEIPPPTRWARILITGSSETPRRCLLVGFWSTRQDFLSSIFVGILAISKEEGCCEKKEWGEESTIITYLLGSLDFLDWLDCWNYDLLGGLGGTFFIKQCGNVECYGNVDSFSKNSLWLVSTPSLFYLNHHHKPAKIVVRPPK